MSSEHQFTAASVWDFPRTSVEVASAGHAPGLYVEPPGVDRRYRREAPAFHDDPDGAALFPHGISAMDITYPAAYLAGLGAGHLVGYRTMLLDDGRFVNDQPWRNAAGRSAYLDRLAHVDPFPNEDTGLRRVPGSEDRFTIDLSGKRIIEVPDPAIVLCSDEPSNWGSFLFRVLPKLANNMELLAEAKVIAYAQSDTACQLLELAGVSSARLVRHDPRSAYRLSRAVLPCMRNPEALIDDASRALFDRMRDTACATSRVATPRCIYVSRQRMRSGRVMMNEADLVLGLAKLGISAVSPETLSAIEQIRTFAGAELVVGPSGAGMFNSVFCRPGTMIVDIESQPDWIHAHTCLFGSAGLHYGIIEARGERVAGNPHQPFFANVPAIIARVKTIIG